MNLALSLLIQVRFPARRSSGWRLGGVPGSRYSHGCAGEERNARPGRRCRQECQRGDSHTHPTDSSGLSAASYPGRRFDQGFRLGTDHNADTG